jgi:xylulose-5-phosphate/fructose-6-phosphate phosphoketolase
MCDEEVISLFIGYGYEPFFVEGSEPEAMHQLMGRTLNVVYDRINGIQIAARDRHVLERPRWPMIMLRSPKGWTGPPDCGDNHRWIAASSSPRR